ncbi:ABC transporter permease [Gluconobacter frateurii]|uniref:ABC transporter permease n=1 Tax=Gluconobacter frateurii TaxID=38308 RepID=UPI001F062E0C|nr:ABC transporter permease [Gluconobacter frateurii]UMM07218.1 ABC transporter permease [Gluconobacter frateurii]
MSESIMTSTERQSSAKTVWPLRQYIWSVKREIWGNKFLFFGPLAIVLLPVILICSSLIRSRVFGGAGPAPDVFFRVTAELLASIANLAGLTVGCVYALGTFYNERKDLSILFWKSLPVSDRLSVVAKASIVLLVTPFFTLVLTYMAVWALAVATMQAYGISLETLTGHIGLGRLFEDYAAYALLNALWWLPIYAILFVISAVVRSVPIVWILGAWAALSITEIVGFHTNYITNTVWDRFLNFPGTGLHDAKMQITARRLDGFNVEHSSVDKLAAGQAHLAALFTSPALWWGVVIGLLCLALTVWLRRRAEPI